MYWSGFSFDLDIKLFVGTRYAFHLAKLPGLKLWKFSISNGTDFSKRWKSCSLVVHKFALAMRDVCSVSSRCSGMSLRSPRQSFRGERGLIPEQRLDTECMRDVEDVGARSMTRLKTNGKFRSVHNRWFVRYGKSIEIVRPFVISPDNAAIPGKRPSSYDC